MWSKSDAHTDSRSITNPDTNTNSDSKPDSNPDANSYCGAERDAHADTYSRSIANPDQYAWDFERCRAFSNPVHVWTDQLIDFTSSDQRIHKLSQLAIRHSRYSDRPAS